MLGSDITLAIAGNKIDLAKDRQVALDVSEEYARNVGAKHYETSAKLNEGVDDLFLSLANDMIAANNAKAQASGVNRANSTRRPNTLLLEDDVQSEQTQTTRSRCCS